MFRSLQERLGSIVDNLSKRSFLSKSDVDRVLIDIHRSLIDADVSLEVVKKLLEEVRKKAIGSKIEKSIHPGKMIIKIVHEELVKILGSENVGINFNKKSPTIIMMIGLQGSGKTTTSAKLAKRIRDINKKKVFMASLDVYRPAGQEQLYQLGLQLDIETLLPSNDKVPYDIACHVLKSTKNKGIDVIILDTAGQTHINEKLILETINIKKKVNPDEIFFISDSMMGQDSINIARAFDKKIGMTGIILTRMDSDNRGGSALSMRFVTGKPIKLISLGEKMDSLEEFHPRRIANRILDMGDITSLFEKAISNIDSKKNEEYIENFSSKKFNLNHFLDQIVQMKKLGGISGIVRFFPGVRKIKNQLSSAGLNEKVFDRQMAIILSMTQQERSNPEIIKNSRKQRIARGSGTNVTDINKLLKMYLQMSSLANSMLKKNNNKTVKNMMNSMEKSFSNLSNFGKKY